VFGRPAQDPLRTPVDRGGPIPQSARRPGSPCHARDPPPNSAVHNQAWTQPGQTTCLPRSARSRGESYRRERDRRRCLCLSALCRRAVNTELPRSALRRPCRSREQERRAVRHCYLGTISMSVSFTVRAPGVQGLMMTACTRALIPGSLLLYGPRVPSLLGEAGSQRGTEERG
jgi:hypothetical protein